LDDIPLSALFITLGVLICLSAFFSGSETALMTLNRYRLKHLAKKKHMGAVRAHRLLKRPDRLIGLILLGNNFVNILASSIATIIGLRIWGEAGVAVAAGILTFVILIFAEVAPKTLAALHPERLAFPAAFIYTALLKVTYPLVWLVNVMANAVLRSLGVDADGKPSETLSGEELRTVVAEAGALIPRKHKTMLLSILDLEQVQVDDIMIPRNEIVGIDIEDEVEEIVEQLRASAYTRLPVFRGSIHSVLGILHVRRAQRLLMESQFSKNELLESLQETYFIPEGTPLNRQLLNFQRQRQRIALVVDEYGDIKGLLTLEDLLEEIVGEFTTDPQEAVDDANQQGDGSFIVDGSATVRDLNRNFGWELPTDGPKTINGLVTEYLEAIPQAGTSLLLAGYPVEIMQTKGNAVKKLRFYPELRRQPLELE
jgi:Mg2+/Co2+ transporter CorB